MRSMTGYGTGKAAREGWEVTAEIRTVNHRFLDLSMRLPKNIAFLEQIVRDRVPGKLVRGHADIYLEVKSSASDAGEVKADPGLAMAYCTAAEEIARHTGRNNDLRVSDLMRMEGVVTLTDREMNHELVSGLCAEAVDQALDQVVGMREKEGAFLKEDLRTHLQAAAALREKILERAPGVVAEYREKLENRLKVLLTEKIDPQRLAQEVALMADRCAIDEELSRLGSHNSQMTSYLDVEGEIGKKMDFLIQEMNREANTIGSKAQDARIAQHVVNLKSEIEKMREQIQNIE